MGIFNIVGRTDVGFVKMDLFLSKFYLRILPPGAGTR
jgi:hypothetical protein